MFREMPKQAKRNISRVLTYPLLVKSQAVASSVDAGLSPDDFSRYLIEPVFGTAYLHGNSGSQWQLTGTGNRDAIL